MAVLWVVLLGPHCCGKTTIGEALAARLAWPFDSEIGESVAGETMEKDDEVILERECDRDGARQRTSRVVESWHLGNMAWHAYRRDSSLGNNKLAERMASAARGAPVKVICVALQCGDEERGRRRRETGRTRLATIAAGMTEAENLEATKCIGDYAATIAADLCEDFFSVRTDRGRGVEEVVDDIQAHLLELLLPPPEVAALPALFLTRRAAYDALARAAFIIGPELLAVASSVRRDYSSPETYYPGVVVAVEGLDGAGKSTLVAGLRPFLGSDAVATRSPPARLDDIRRVIDDSKMRQKKTDKAFRRLKRAFYSLGNYALADDLLAMEGSPPAVVDRFAASTIAYTLGAADVVERPRRSWLAERLPSFLTSTVASASFLSPKVVVEDDRNRWPSDLPRPDVVLVLDADEGVRRERIERRSDGRGIGVGEWERAMKENDVLGAAIARRLKAMRDVPLDVVDANASTPKKVLTGAISKLLQRGIAVVRRQVVEQATSEFLLDQVDTGQSEPTTTTSDGVVAQHHGASSLKIANKIIREVGDALERESGLEGWTVQENTLHILTSTAGEVLVPQRDLFGDFKAVVMLSRPGRDFIEGTGAFFVAKTAEYDESHDEKRQYFSDLRQGDAVLFRQTNTIHGADRLRTRPSARGRLTTSWHIF